MNKFRIGATVGGRYRVLSDIGKGGMGAVVLVFDEARRHRVALKYCKDVDTVRRRRFTREVRAMARVSSPHVITVLDDHLDHDPPFFTMPVAKCSLDAEVLALRGQPADAVEALIDACKGVEALHAKVGPHRDLKPHNLLRMPDGRVVVSDLGLAKIEPRDTTILTQTTDVLGSRMYAAPEQLAPGGSRGATAQTDVYGLGMTGYHLVAGTHPTPVDPDKVHAVVRSIIVKATQQVPTKRYGNVAEMRQDLEAGLASLKSPKDPLDLFDDQLKEIIDHLSATKKYYPHKLRGLLRTLGTLADEPSVLMDKFAEIPEALLKSAAANMPKDYTQALRHYCDALDDSVELRNYDYAEDVAGLMDRTSFLQSTDALVSALAVKATLIAAVDLHRWKAMGVLDGMLTRVTDDEVAGAVANVLREQRERFAVVSKRIEVRELHQALRRVKREVETTA